MNRRSFLRRVAQSVALAAVAPAALAAVPRVPKQAPKWNYSSSGIYAQLQACNRLQATPERIDIFTDRETASIIRQAMVKYYQGKIACESAIRE
jgi:hypothetical protein